MAIVALPSTRLNVEPVPATTFGSLISARLFTVIAAKRQALAADLPNRQALSLNDEIHAHVDETLDVLERKNFTRRLWAKDGSLWKEEPEHQTLIAVDRRGERILRRELCEVRFVKLFGRQGWREE